LDSIVPCIGSQPVTDLEGEKENSKTGEKKLLPQGL
jgi:hypothetical protein